MTNRDKNILASLCRMCSSFHEVLVEAADRDVSCAKATVKNIGAFFIRKMKMIRRILCWLGESHGEIANLKIEKNKLQAEIDRLRMALKSVKQQTINLGDYEEIGAIATISDICDKYLNGESLKI